MGVQPDRLAQELADRDQIGSVITEVLRAKALTLITERATVTDEAGQTVDIEAAMRPDEAEEVDASAAGSEAEASADEASADEASAAGASAGDAAAAEDGPAEDNSAEDGPGDGGPGGSTE